MIEGLARAQADRVAQERHVICDGSIPPELRETAKHALGYLSPITPAPHLVVGKPRSWLSHGNKAALFYDRRTTPYDLQLVISADIDVCEPDSLTARMRPHLDDLANHHILHGPIRYITLLSPGWTSKSVVGRF